MKKYTLIGMMVIITFFTAGVASAAAPKWDLDVAHSGFYFGIKHIYSEVKGFFSDYEGTILFDPADLEASRFDFAIKVKSVNTNNGKRDGHLLSDEFFDNKKYPTMTFKSQSIAQVKENQYTVEGMLTIKDVSKKITVPFTFFGTQPSPFNPKITVAGFEARMTIDRLAYNVGNGKFYKMGVVGKDVDILISLEVTRNN